MKTANTVRVVKGQLTLTKLGRETLLAAQLRAISAEMRSRKINHGRNVSPTLVAWADKIDAALDASRIGGPRP